LSDAHIALRDDAAARSASDAREIAPGYRSYGAVLAASAQFEARGARAHVIARSAGGHAVHALEFGPPDANAVVLALSGIHAMEWIGVETMLATLEALIARPPTDRRILAVPVVNVDGYLQAEADMGAGRKRFRRGNANGVDLNRNWPTNFRTKAPLAVLLPGVFRSGAAALSEPEIAGIVRALDAGHARGDRLLRAVSLHSFGRKILYPWGARWARPRDVAPMQRAAEAIRSAAGERYGIVQSARWVPGAFAYGMEIDHLHAAYGANVLLVECSSGGLRVTAPGSWVTPWRWFNPPDPRASVAAIAPAVERFIRSEDGVADVVPAG